MFVVGYDLVVLWLCLFLSLVSACLFISVLIHTCVCVKASEDYSFVLSCQPAAIAPFFISTQLRLNQVARTLLLISAPCISLFHPSTSAYAHLYLIFLYPAISPPRCLPCGLSSVNLHNDTFIISICNANKSMHGDIYCLKPRLMWVCRYHSATVKSSFCLENPISFFSFRVLAFIFDRFCATI